MKNNIGIMLRSASYDISGENANDPEETAIIYLFKDVQVFTSFAPYAYGMLASPACIV